MKETIERRKKVKKLYQEGKDYLQIADELKVKITKVYQDVHILKKEGEISSERRKNSAIAKRRQEVKKLYEQGKTYQEIVETMKIGKPIVYQDIIFLKKEEEISKESRKSLEIAKRREGIEKLYKEGKSYKQIANKLKIKISTVSQDIHILKKRGKVSKGKINITKEVEQKILKRQQEVKKLYEQGKTYEEIVYIVNISKSTVYQDILALRERGEIAKEKRKTARSLNSEVSKRRKKVKELYEKGKSYKQIADELKTKKSIVSQDLVILRKRGEMAKVKKSEDKSEKSKESEDKLEKPEDKRFRRIVEYIKSCRKDIPRAVGYARSFANSNYLTEEQRKKLKEFIAKAEKMYYQREPDER